MNLVRKGLRKLVRIIADKRLISSKVTVILLHTIETLRIPNITQPKDLNEKLIWLAFNKDTSMWSRLTDKYEVRQYVRDCGLSHILIPFLGLYNTAHEIDFLKLPNKFVIKSTNGSAQTIFVKDKSHININKIRDKINSWKLKRFGYATGETHYLCITPRIIIEDMLPFENNKLPIDYKFLCFNGYVHSCLVCTERDNLSFNSRLNLMELPNWKEIKGAVIPSYEGDVSNFPKPVKLNEMIEIAEKLSEGFPFVRVDLYEVDGSVYFGEMTFTPFGFHFPLTHSTLIKLGKLL